MFTHRIASSAMTTARLLVLVGLMAGASCARADGPWFTVVGDPANPVVDTIEVDASSMAVATEEQAVRVRVSRATVRDSWDGVPYRSYVSEVMVDCANRKARYSRIVFYRQPLWQGSSHNTSTFSRDNPRPMLFRDVAPNPTQRIIRAACERGRVKTGTLPDLDLSGDLATARVAIK